MVVYTHQLSLTLQTRYGFYVANTSFSVNPQPIFVCVVKFFRYIHLSLCALTLPKWYNFFREFHWLKEMLRQILKKILSVGVFSSTPWEYYSISMILKGKVQNEDVIELFVSCILFVSNGIPFFYFIRF